MRESMSSSKLVRINELRSQNQSRVKMQPLSFHDDERRQAKQTFDLCRVVDKQKTGRIVSQNFNRIA